jgi:hypothetical integral membrane protein (TIGR02206 family)
VESWFENSQPFKAFGTSHLCVLSISAVLLVGMCVVARGKPPRLGVGSRPERVQALTLAAVLFLLWPVKVWTYRMMGHAYVLPMHLCDWAGVIGGIALVRRHILAAELVYFWGMAGTLNGLLTPDLGQEFPHPRFFVFFALHAGVVMTALYVVIGLRLHPRPGAVWRMFLWTQVYVGVALVINLITRTSEKIESNYGFLLHKPLDAKNPILEALGDWPWYIFGLELVCLVFFFLFNLPFWWLRRKQSVTVS